MMARGWKPGDVAMIDAKFHHQRLAIMTERGTWACVDGEGLEGWLNARPMVVIDPEDDDQVTLMALAYAAEKSPDIDVTTAMRTALLSLLPSPKPEEPTGWGAVVEDRNGHYWTLVARESAVWIHIEHGRRGYSDIDVVRVVSAGVDR